MSPSRPLEAVLFDMDGLLVDSEPLWFEVEHSVMARLGGHWTEADQRKLVGGSLHTSVGYLISRGTRDVSHDEVAGWLISGMADLLAEREVTVMPGAASLLAEIRAAGIPRVLVTSSERVIMDAVLASLIRHGISFTATVCGADVTRPKPHPEPYLRAARLIGADPRACVALEDSPNGVGAALAAGCVTVAVPGVAEVPERPGLTIAASLADLDLAKLRDLVAASRLSRAGRQAPGQQPGQSDRQRGPQRGQPGARGQAGGGRPGRTRTGRRRQAGECAASRGRIGRAARDRRGDRRPLARAELRDLPGELVRQCQDEHSAHDRGEHRDADRRADLPSRAGQAGRLAQPSERDGQQGGRGQLADREPDPGSVDHQRERDQPVRDAGG